MGSRGEKDRAKQIQDRCQTILVQLLKDEDNKYCVDCDAKGPRWASWNLGIFLCIRCAGIHRNLGVHISKVKSVNLDSWTPEQVVSLQQMGNSRARAVYEANLPDSFRRPQNDSALEAFVRAKYEQKKYIAKEWVPQAAPKVNWDKEIDEEIERQKKKKKSSLAPLPAAVDKKYAKSDVIPSLPKPKSSVSPKLGRSATSQPDVRPGQADLLGLDAAKTEPKPAPSEDIFSNFFSGPPEPPAERTEVEAKADLKTEEQNFFNQAAPTEKEKSKLTKDSILALYSQTPSNLNQFGGVPPGGYNQQFNSQFQQPQTSFATFGAVQNGTSQSQFSQPAPQNQFNQGASQNQFNQTVPQNQFNQNPSQHQFNQTPSQNQFNPTPPQNQFNPTPPPNQFNPTPPQNQFNQTPPQNQFNPTPPQNQFNPTPPQNQFNQTPTQNQFNPTPPQSQFNQTPPQNQFSQAASQFSQFAQQPVQFPQQFGQFASQPFAQSAFAQNGSMGGGFGGAPSQPPLAQQFGAMSLGQHAFAGAFAAQPNANVASNGTWQ